MQHFLGMSINPIKWSDIATNQRKLLVNINFLALYNNSHKKSKINVIN